MTAEELTARALNRATLERQLLLRREPLDVVAATHRVLALQSQHSASPYLALWNRVQGWTPESMDTAFADGALVRATLLRMTLQTVTAADYPTVRDAIEPTMYATHIDGRFTPAGLTVAAAHELLAQLREFAAEPRGADELKAWLAPRIGAVSPAGVWTIVRSYAPFVRVSTGGAWSFGPRSSYVCPDPGPALDREQSDAALTVVVARFLAAYGPSTAADIGKFALVQQARVKRALRALGDEVREYAGPGPRPLFDLAAASLPPETSPAPPRLLPMWDNALLAHADRDRLIPPQYRKLVIRSNGDVLPTALVDGLVAGLWRTADDGIEVSTFHPLTAADWRGLTAEAEALAPVLSAREPGLYQRFDRWWKGAPFAETRPLASF